MGGEWWIRRAEPGDGEAVSEVLRRAGIAGWGGYLGAARIDRAVRGSSHPADLVAVDGEGVFAFVAWDDRTGEIERLFTDPRGERRGAATALLDLATEALAEAGREQAWLYTEERNDAVDFYLRRGWREEGEARVREWYGARLREPRFVKDLEPPPSPSDGPSVPA